MLIAEVRLKGFEGNLSERIHLFRTDIENLKQGDVVLVFGRYGLELALFEGYFEGERKPNGYIVDRVSGERVETRVNEQKRLLELALKAEFEDKLQDLEIL